MSIQKTAIVIGGGAAGIFGAIQIATLYPDAKVIVLEKTRQLLSKVKISGGGRCNVTHACFDPKELIKNYPRGQKELLGPFYAFGPQDMIAWLEARGVELKREDDGRMFPVTDSSSTIIECFLSELRHLNIEVITECSVESILPNEHGYTIDTTKRHFKADALLIATGSFPPMYSILKTLGVKLVPLVPSLFTLNMPKSPFNELPGTVIKDAHLKIKGSSLEMKGPLLITHFGLSGPCALKLSAFAARYLHEKGYKAHLVLNIDHTTTVEEKVKWLLTLKAENPQKQIGSFSLFGQTRKFSHHLLMMKAIDPASKLVNMSNKTLQEFAAFLQEIPLDMDGKTTFKEEFVTAGGVDLTDINFKTLEHKELKRLFFAGEILDIDGITGGFNFQSAWTTSTLAARAMEGYLC
jgi:predicted Rossmann fold flavoprotein